MPRHDTSSFVVETFRPAYLSLTKQQRAERVAAALKELQDCCACPRNCHLDRLVGQVGICQTARYAYVASAFVHRGEENCLSGSRGSGTIFFSGCNLRCVFCQNWDISQRLAGRECSAEQVAAVMLQLQSDGCHNVNFVTPEHVVPQVIEAIVAAIPLGLQLPVVYNTSAYDCLASLRLLDGLVDIYMPDFKFWERATAKRLAKAPDYPERARAALLEMHRQVGPLRFGSDGLARRGVLVRHLVMPGQVEESAEIFDWLAEHVSRDTYVNIMGQYRPEHEVGTTAGPTQPPRFAEVNRRPCIEEMQRAWQAARRAGLWRFA